MHKVVVLIPVYNDPQGLEAALLPLCQAAQNFDVLVVDDGSDPPIQLEPGRYPFRVILLRLDHNAGIAAALNRGLRHILADEYVYVARLDAWDRCKPERLARQIAFLKENPEHAIVGCDVDFVDWEGRALYRYGPKLRHDHILREMRYRPSFIHPAVMMRAAALRAIGPYSEEYPGSEDYELFLRLLSRYQGANLAEILVHVYLNPQGISLTQRRLLIRTRLQLQLKHFAWLNPHSYLGTLRTLSLSVVPYQLLYAIKCLVRPPGR